MKYIKLNMKGFLGTFLHTFQAQDAFCAVFSAAGVVGNLYLHGADPTAFAAGVAFVCIIFDPEQGKIAGRF